MSKEAKRYILTVRKIAPEARDEFRRLSRPGTYFEIRPSRVGERAAYSVEMTEEEYERATRGEADPSSNLIALEENRRMTPDSIPGADATAFLAMNGALGEGLNGGGVRVGVSDDGITAAVSSFFGSRLVASRGYDPTGTSFLTSAVNAGSEHGNFMASLAVPPAASLVFAAQLNYELDGLIAGLYWMVDTAGVDIINMSWSTPDSSTALNDATTHAAGANVIQFASRGNESDSGTRYPANSPGVRNLSAYATTTGRIIDYSSYGNVWAASCGGYLNWLQPNGSEGAAGLGGGTSSASALATNIAARVRGMGVSKGNVVGYMASKARRTGASPTYEGNGVLQLDAVVNAVRRDKPESKNLDGSPLVGGGIDGCAA